MFKVYKVLGSSFLGSGMFRVFWPRVLVKGLGCSCCIWHHDISEKIVGRFLTDQKLGFQERFRK